LKRGKTAFAERGRFFRFLFKRQNKKILPALFFFRPVIFRKNGCFLTQRGFFLEIIATGTFFFCGFTIFH